MQKDRRNKTHPKAPITACGPLTLTIQEPLASMLRCAAAAWETTPEELTKRHLSDCLNLMVEEAQSRAGLYASQALADAAGLPADHVLRAVAIEFWKDPKEGGLKNRPLADPDKYLLATPAKRQSGKLVESMFN